MGHASRTIKSVKKTMSFMAYVDLCERMIHMKKIKITKAGIKKFLTAHQYVLTCTAIMLLVPAVGIIFQVLLCALILYILVRKNSKLASGLLNGQPSLGGSSMT